jgi:membrane-bound lytic murein transglycosylase MltF
MLIIPDGLIYRYLKKHGLQIMLFKKLILSAFILALFGCEETHDADDPDAVGLQVTAAAAGQPQVPDSGTTGTDSLTSKLQRVEESLAEMEQQMGMDLLREPWTGDVDAMIDNRLIRVLTVYNLGRYYVDKGQESGLTYEWFKMFESFVNEKLDRKHLKIHVVFVPLARDELIPALLGGRGDIVAAGLTITPERAELAQFSDPVTRAIAEILVTGPSAPAINSIEDLAGREIYVRASSSYRASIDALNERFASEGLAPVEAVDALEQLEDSDILEMVNAGLINWAVVDDYKADFWGQVYDKLQVRKDLVFRSGGRIGYAVRKDSPKLLALLNEFVATHKQGSLKGNILINRYLGDTDRVKNALDQEGLQRFEMLVDTFLKYGTTYGIDYLMVAAQGYQESRLDQNARSNAGAIGIMQLLPSTAADANVGIPDISTADANIHAGIRYLDFIRKRYFDDPSIDAFNRNMFAFAAYNAGPARVRKLRQTAADLGYDPNVWFDNVEVIAAREIGRETVQYVANILKYYIAYSQMLQQKAKKLKARDDAGIG